MSELYLTAEELILNLNELRIPYKGGYRGLIVNTPAGLVISVQWGMSSYCSNRFADCRDWDQKRWLQTLNAEICMWWSDNPDKFYTPEGWEIDSTDGVFGWIPCYRILEAIKYLYGDPNEGREERNDVRGRDSRSLWKEEVLLISG